jgi:hypothetical protein
VVDPTQYAHLDHGYATTVHKSQSATVDHTFTLVTPHFDRHSTYVAFSRHRESASAFYAAEDFDAGREGVSLSPGEIRDCFRTVVSRARPKELAHDYLDHGDTYRYDDDSYIGAGESPRHRKPQMTFPTSMSEIDAVQQRAAERLRDKHFAPEVLPSHHIALEHENELDPGFGSPSSHEHQNRHELQQPSLEDDFEL